MKPFVLCAATILALNGLTAQAQNSGTKGVAVHDCRISFGPSYKRTYLVEGQNATVAVFSAKIALHTDGSTLRGTVDGQAFEGVLSEARFNSKSEGAGVVSCDQAQTVSYVLRQRDKKEDDQEFFTLDAQLKKDHLPNAVYDYQIKYGPNLCYIGDQGDSMHALTQATGLHADAADANTIEFAYVAQECINPQPYYEGSTRCDGYNPVNKTATVKSCETDQVGE